MIDVTNIELLSEPFQINDIRHLWLFLSVDTFHVLTILKYQSISIPFDSFFSSQHPPPWHLLAKSQSRLFSMFTKLAFQCVKHSHQQIGKNLVDIFTTKYSVHNFGLCFKIGFLKCILRALKCKTVNSEKVMNDKMSIYDCGPPTPGIALHSRTILSRIYFSKKLDAENTLSFKMCFFAQRYQLQKYWILRSTKIYKDLLTYNVKIHQDLLRSWDLPWSVY